MGFELEFTGISLQQACDALLSSLGGEVREASAAESLIEIPDLGDFRVEIDWNYLKKLADGQGMDQPHLNLLASAASALVPIEVVCPPLPMDRLASLDPLIDALRDAGARGTEDSILAAFGVHINTEIPACDAQTLDRYLKAFALLQWWLVRAHEVDLTRRLTPYIDLYPDDYLRAVLQRRDPTLAELLEDYLAHNATRNRALDLLPLLAHLDEGRVRSVVDDDRIKARPAFHYRLPNCQIDQPDWSLAASWNVWCVVEHLADQADARAYLAREFLARWQAPGGIDHDLWTTSVDQWISQSGLA